MVCEKFSNYLPEYQMHILPFDELLLICSCIFVVEFLLGLGRNTYSEKAKASSSNDHEWHAFKCCQQATACCLRFPVDSTPVSFPCLNF